MKINDVVSGVLLGLLAAVVYLHAQGFPQMPGQNVGPNMFPQLIATGLMICAVLLCMRGLREAGEGKWFALPDWLGANRATVGFLLIPVALLFFTAVSETLGFIITAILFLVPLFVVFGVRMRAALPAAVLASLCIHALFYKLLKVPLPWGLLSPFAW